MVRPEGFEPPTLGSEDRCSIQLSHGRILCCFFNPGGIRPPLAGRRPMLYPIEPRAHISIALFKKRRPLRACAILSLLNSIINVLFWIQLYCSTKQERDLQQRLMSKYQQLYQLLMRVRTRRSTYFLIIAMLLT